ncbi:major capsid protein [Escherichia coli]|nr:major capsid protein [Escherichia coli]
MASGAGTGAAVLSGGLRYRKRTDAGYREKPLHLVTSNGVTIVDRIGTRILRDPYTNKPFVGFYTTKRTGGMLVDSQAIKLLKIAAA